MQEYLLALVTQYGYISIALIICIENIFPPIPSEVVLLFGGFLAFSSGLNQWMMILAATAGAVAGAIVLYLVGRLLPKEKLKKLLSGKVGKVLRLAPADIDKAETWFARYEYKAVFICRCVPVLRSVISVPAGMARMRPTPFLLLTIAGSFIWNTILVWAGFLAGDGWEAMAKYVDGFTTAAVILLGLAAVAGLWLWLKKRTNNEKSR